MLYVGVNSLANAPIYSALVVEHARVGVQCLPYELSLLSVVCHET